MKESPRFVTAPRLQGTRVLVVEDSPDSMEALSVLLQFEGAIVCAAHDGLAALTQLRAHELDLVMSDIEMPRLDGYGFVVALRREPGKSALPAIALTGRGNDDDVQRALDSGFDAHLTKPVVLDDLVAVITRLLHP
jgi:two-component system CheB/CheR fusion protein